MNDFKNFTHKTVHTYLPGITEPIPHLSSGYSTGNIHCSHRLNEIFELNQSQPIFSIQPIYYVINIPKGDRIEVVLDARHLSSKTDHSFESWLMEPIVSQLARANEKTNQQQV